MTTVTFTDSEIRAYNHVGRTGLCIAVSSVLQTTARILNAGMALDAYILEQDPHRLEIRAAIGEFLTADAEVSEQMRVARERAGRRAFVQAVFNGTKRALQEIAQLNVPEPGKEPLLEIKDTREMRDKASTHRAQ